jgi:hypothetical protein
VGVVRRTTSDSKERRTAITPDGQWEISLTVGQPAKSAVLKTEDGAMVTPDWLFEMRAL